MGPPPAGEVGVTICRASLGGATGQTGSAQLPTHPWGETLAGSTGSGLLLQELRVAAPGIGGALEVRPGDPGAVVLRAKLTMVIWTAPRTGSLVGLESE